MPSRTQNGSAERAISIVTLAAAVATLLVTVGGLIIASQALRAAIVIPERIDHAASVRAEIETCRETIFTLRDRSLALRRGYAIDPYDRLSRLSDWGEETSSLDQVPFVCSLAFSFHPDLSDTFKVLKTAEDGQQSVAYQGSWDDTNTLNLVNWSDNAIQTIG